MINVDTSAGKRRVDDLRIGNAQFEKKKTAIPSNLFSNDNQWSSQVRSGQVRSGQIISGQGKRSFSRKRQLSGRLITSTDGEKAVILV